MSTDFDDIFGDFENELIAAEDALDEPFLNIEINVSDELQIEGN